MTTIYLDHNSTTPIDPTVADAMRAVHAARFLNPASQHRSGQLARRKLESTRTAIASLLGATTNGMAADQLVFTSGGTESNNLALLGLAQAKIADRSAGFPAATSRHESSRSAGNNGLPQVLVSAIEHPSVIGAAEPLARMGFIVRKIPVDQHGVCDLVALEAMLDSPTALVSLMLANNETGVIQPVAEAAALCRERNIWCHTDAVQAVGKVPVDFGRLGVDALTFTAHKFNGPRGIGGLLLRHGVVPQPTLFGGFQQMAIRPGTEDVALSVGMLTALELYRDCPERMRRVEQLRNELQQRLLAMLPQAVVIGHSSPRVPPTLNIAFPGIDRQSFLMAADMQELAVSTGSACASGSSELSPVLLAMGLPKNVVESAIRISLGVSNTAAEVDESVRRIVALVNQLSPTF